MVTLTAKAAEKIVALAAAQGKKEPILRVKVGAGGCSGMSYAFELIDAVKPDDAVFAGHGAKAVVDPRSDFFVGGSEVDYHETLMEAKFVVRNPLAKSTCSCGTSFNV
ncbi:MAG: iron-sulfur cluster assembly accessory protein [Elusimicrobia bacterium]|nr:iron-sulfur cluster assembly accessory protein [Elusimicrobiota bacterium]MDE2236691.1 iron-sulfur cluster assembly accessory protein [Elusimicrobiota bacterium]MDE2425121.1 iron-sulfur cluster assembly accessory protein [Elusimicrobiota bacterium]